MLKKILIAVAVVILLLIGYIAMQPSHFHIDRSVTIAASPEAVYPHIASLKQMNEWSPWDKMDPALKRTYEGPDSGVGAAYSWEGNAAVGSGKMTVTEAKPSEEVRYKLEFIKPMPGICDVVFTVKPQDGKTTVTWAMDGEQNFIGKGMCLAMGGMDKMIGPQFEAGLNGLKNIVEKK